MDRGMVRGLTKRDAGKGTGVQSRKSLRQAFGVVYKATEAAGPGEGVFAAPLCNVAWIGRRDGRLGPLKRAVNAKDDLDPLVMLCRGGVGGRLAPFPQFPNRLAQLGRGGSLGAAAAFHAGEVAHALALGPAYC